MKINLPGSKSIALRALALRYACGTAMRIEGITPCTDVDEMVRGLEILQESVKSETHGRIEISEGAAPYRFLIALAASTPGAEITIVPGPRLARRPVEPLVAALRKMGAEIIKAPVGEGYAIRGKKLKGGFIRVDTSKSSQFETALLLSSPLWENPAEYVAVCGEAEGQAVAGKMSDSPSKPYRVMTRRMMAQFALKPEVYGIETDWSAASVFFAAKLLKPDLDLEFPGLKEPGESLQGDAVIQSIVEGILKADGMPLTVDLADSPDLYPALYAACRLSGRPVTFTGTGNLKYKESDRLKTMRGEIEKVLGKPQGSVIQAEAHSDHRVVMAVSLARLAGYNIKFDNPRAVEKSFPGFFEEFGKLEEGWADLSDRSDKSDRSASGAKYNRQANFSDEHT